MLGTWHSVLFFYVKLVNSTTYFKPSMSMSVIMKTSTTVKVCPPIYYEHFLRTEMHPISSKVAKTSNLDEVLSFFLFFISFVLSFFVVVLPA